MFCLFSLAIQTARAVTISCPPGGNETIQACIDQAAPGDKIVFSGSYQIDPAKAFVQILDKSNLRLVGDDNNPPLFSCQLDADGRPTADFRLNAVFNVNATANVVENLVFDGLQFSGCSSAITLSALEPAAGYDNITIRNLEITNNIVGINILAPTNDVEVRDCSNRPHRPRRADRDGRGSLDRHRRLRERHQWPGR